MGIQLALAARLPGSRAQPRHALCLPTCLPACLLAARPLLSRGPIQAAEHGQAGSQHGSDTHRRAFAAAAAALGVLQWVHPLSLLVVRHCLRFLSIPRPSQSKSDRLTLEQLKLAPSRPENDDDNSFDMDMEDDAPVAAALAPSLSLLAAFALPPSPPLRRAPAHALTAHAHTHAVPLPPGAALPMPPGSTARRPREFEPAGDLTTLALPSGAVSVAALASLFGVAGASEPGGAREQALRFKTASREWAVRPSALRLAEEASAPPPTHE